MSAIKFLAIVAASFALAFAICWVGLALFGGASVAWALVSVVLGTAFSVCASICQI